MITPVVHCLWYSQKSAEEKSLWPALIKASNVWGACQAIASVGAYLSLLFKIAPTSWFSTEKAGDNVHICTSLYKTTRKWDVNAIINTHMEGERGSMHEQQLRLSWIQMHFFQFSHPSWKEALVCTLLNQVHVVAIIFSCTCSV